MTLMLIGTWSHSSARTQVRISSVIIPLGTILRLLFSSFPTRRLGVRPHAEQLRGIEIAMACCAPREIGSVLLRGLLHHLPVTRDAQAVHGVHVPGGNSLLRPFLRLDDGFLRRHVRVTLGTGRRGGSILHLVRVPVK